MHQEISHLFLFLLCPTSSYENTRNREKPQEEKYPREGGERSSFYENLTKQKAPPESHFCTDLLNLTIATHPVSMFPAQSLQDSFPPQGQGRSARKQNP